MSRIHSTRRSAVVATLAAVAAMAAFPAGSQAAGAHHMHVTHPAGTPPKSLLRKAPRAARRAAHHHRTRHLAHSATLSFTLPNPQADCIAPGNNGALKTLSISGPRVYGVDYNTTVYWRPLTWRAGTTSVIAGSAWHQASATPTRPAVFPADSFNFFGTDNYYQQWQAGVEVWRWSPTRQWESAVAGYLTIRHVFTGPIAYTTYSTVC